MTQVWRASTTRGRLCFLLGVGLLWVGLAWSYPLVAGLGGCLLALVVIELGAVLGGQSVAVDRVVAPTVVTRFSPCHGQLTVAGRRRRGLVRLDVADRVGGELVTVELPGGSAESAAAGGGSDAAVASYEIPTPRRGLIDVGPVQLRLAGITGMAALSTTSGDVDQIRVLPRRLALVASGSGQRRSVAGGDDSTELGGTDLVGLHEYVAGDDLRRLHWATSARTGTLMVREDADPAEPHFYVLLDDRGPAYADPEQFEDAVEMAAAVCAKAGGMGYPVRLRTTSGRSEVTVPGSVSRQPRHEMQDLEWLLAEIELTDDSVPVEVARRDLDLAVAVTGTRADLRELGLALGTAPTRLIMVADPHPVLAASHEDGHLVLRADSAEALARAWDGAMA